MPMPAYGMRSDQSLFVTPRLATQSRRRRTLPSARRCGVLASRHAKAATSEYRLHAVVLGVGVVVGLAVLEFHQLQAVRSDDRDRRCSRSPAATFCLVATAKRSGFLEAHAGPVIVSWNRSTRSAGSASVRSFRASLTRSRPQSSRSAAAARVLRAPSAAHTVCR